MYAPLPSDVAAKLSKFLPLILPLTGVLITGIFLLDLLSPLGRVVWMLYFLPLFLTFWFSHRQYLIPLATVCMALLIVGFIHTSPGISVEPGGFQAVLASGGTLDHNISPPAAQGGGGSAAECARSVGTPGRGKRVRCQVTYSPLFSPERELQGVIVVMEETAP